MSYESDIDKLVNDSRELLESTRKLEERALTLCEYKITPFKEIVEEVFKCWLTERFEDWGEVFFQDYSLWDSDKKIVVKWDVIIEAKKDKNYLFMIETGDVCGIEPDELMDEKRKACTFSRKIEKTLKFFDKVSRLNVDSLQGIKYSSQGRTIHRLLDHKIVFVYVCSDLGSGIKEAIDKIESPILMGAKISKFLVK